MPFTKHVNITVRSETSAVAMFTHLFEGVWDVAEIEFARVFGTRTWKPIVPPYVDITSEAKSEITRLMNTQYAATAVPVRARRQFKRPTQAYVLPTIDAPAGVTMRPSGAPPVTPVKPCKTQVVQVTQVQSEMPDSCDCEAHTNTWVRGSGRWRSHALSFGCVGE